MKMDSPILPVLPMLLKKRFLLNFYGISSQQLDDDTGKYPSNITAREAFELKKGSSRQGYKLADMKDADGNPMELSDQTALDMINIIYTMELTRFQKYESTPLPPISARRL